jgi:hypothetical protein
VIRAAVAAVILCTAAPAVAKSSREYAYAYDPVWSALVRFLRVDEGVKLLEKDAESGYVVFELVDGKKTFSGAAELMKIEAGTRVVVRISDRPSYMEQGMLDRFADKLRDELGEPIVPEKKPEPEPEPEKKK